MASHRVNVYRTLCSSRPTTDGYGAVSPVSATTSGFPRLPEASPSVLVDRAYPICSFFLHFGKGERSVFLDERLIAALRVLRWSESGWVGRSAEPGRKWAACFQSVGGI